MMFYGYHRVSTKEQNLERGIKGIEDFCKSRNYKLEKVFVDKMSGRTVDRPRYTVLKEDVLREGDTLIIYELDRLARDKKAISNELRYYDEHNIRVMILDIPTTTTDLPDTDAMNANSQKRGEWEPVLRHSINLKIEEESKNTGRGVTSFFIADSFDCNTINIWKAIAGVPLQSSIDKTRFTDNVVIMPVNTDELIMLMDKANDYDSIISKVHELFEVDKVKFDIQWRDKFMNTII